MHQIAYLPGRVQFVERRQNRSSIVRVYLVDDHQMVLDGMAALLKNVPGIDLLGTSSDSRKSLALIEKLHPDILITDLEMPGWDGIELTRQVKAILPDIRVLALSMHQDYSRIRQMMEAGVQGYLLKTAGRDELTKALDALMAGKLYFSDEAVEALLQGKKDTERRSADRVLLSPREKEIVALIAQELSNEQIAGRLFISLQTVETHRKNIMRKTEAKSAIGLVKMAMEKGWI